MVYRWTTIIPLIILNASFAPVAESSERDFAIGTRRVAEVRRDEIESAEEILEFRSPTRGAAETMRSVELRDAMMERAAALSDADALRKEFIEILDEGIKRSERWRRTQILAASLLRGLGDGRAEMVGVLDDLERVAGSFASLARRTLAFCDFIDSVLDEMPTPLLATVRIRYKLDELRRRSMRALDVTARFSGRIEPPVECRVLAVNDDLNVVVLGVGADQGVRNGLLWRIEMEDENVLMLKTIAARPSISAALVCDGAIGAVAPGMTAVAGSVEQNTQR